jgi:hypothetical protein
MRNNLIDDPEEKCSCCNKTQYLDISFKLFYTSCGHSMYLNTRRTIYFLQMSILPEENV